ncbi:hypothetical protein DFAR_3300001 [Desulfarculales bacterium]
MTMLADVSGCKMGLSGLNKILEEAGAAINFNYHGA